MNKYNKASKAFKKLRFSASTKDVDIGKAFIEIVEVEELVNEMYEMLEKLINNSSFQSNFPAEAEEIELALKKARGEHE